MSLLDRSCCQHSSATPAFADNKTTEFTGTADFVSWTDTRPPEVNGQTTHEYIFTEWAFTTSDPRASGVYGFTGKCMWPALRPPHWGNCNGKWTLDVNGDQIPDWSGTFAIGAQTYHIVWNCVGKGLGPYDGLHMTFDVYESEVLPFVVSGRIHGR